MRYRLLLALLGFGTLPVLAIGENPTPTPTPTAVPAASAPLSDVAVITGQLTYTNAYFTAGVDEPLVVLEDQTGFIRRDTGYILSVESQQLGQITSDFYQSPFTYKLALPKVPQGELNDVDQDGTADTGVMVFAVAYWNNIWGDAFLQERDLGGGGWSTAYASTLVSGQKATRGEYLGGRLVVYAPDAAQGFPSDFGADGRLFTPDDPITALAPGYTVVDMDTRPFTFIRDSEVTIDLLEGEAAADDFSSLNFVDAFDAMIEKLAREYAFTEYKNIDWDALSAEFRPQVQLAQRNRDQDDFSAILKAFSWRIPDGHVSVSWTQATYESFLRDTESGVGLAVRTLDDGRVIASFVTPNGPAAAMGIVPGAEIITINGQPAADHIAAAQPWSAPFSTRDFEYLQKERYAMRFPAGATVAMVYSNPGDTFSQEVTLEATIENESFRFSSFNRGVNPVALPVETRLLPSNYLLVTITSFLDSQRLTVDLWERMLQQAAQQDVAGIIIDMRNNGGGNGFLARQMAAYFFDEPLLVGLRSQYDPGENAFVVDEQRPDTFILPEPGLRYEGRVAVLIGPACASACEFFSYAMSLQNRAAIVGHYTTAGLGGGVEVFYMPADISVQFTVIRGLDADGNIHIEGRGVAPTVDVPVTAETVLSSGDPLLEAAIEALEGQP
jgi:C-terminal processing protease CtpA/Prc